MKLTNRDFAAKGRGAAQGCGIFFFCGQDEAGASAAANDLVSWLPEPGERVEMSGAELRSDPAKLGDEARTTSLFGDQRHIWVRASGDEAHEALKVLVETGDSGAGEACPVVIVATSATDKSRTAKLLEKRKDALVAMFYPPDLPSVTKSVRALADGAGVRLGGDLAERIARAANLDVRLARSEVEKLALYLDASAQSPQAATEEDLDAIGAASEDDGFAPLVNAVLGGQAAKLGVELARMKQLGLNPVGVLLAFERRAAQLARIAATLGSRSFGDLDRGEEARLGIFFKEKREIGQQFGLWRHGDKLDRLTQRLVTLHRELLTNSQAAELLLAQGLAEIARVAGARAR
ncbi:DNA polymerase III subunit delta [Qipengyuania sp. YG27]|uniref:DNA-directed DNA polymerase n=1 Tax=Qipengyuania mesophila TaxID=2867246 RepID=A0ABS7JV07_9SPHN|nr:DNA polymerase III subunit delta [Qipengyuania mesophila]